MQIPIKLFYNSDGTFNNTCNENEVPFITQLSNFVYQLHFYTPHNIGTSGSVNCTFQRADRTTTATYSLAYSGNIVEVEGVNYYEHVTSLSNDFISVSQRSRDNKIYVSFSITSGNTINPSVLNTEAYALNCVPIIKSRSSVVEGETTLESINTAFNLALNEKLNTRENSYETITSITNNEIIPLLKGQDDTELNKKVSIQQLIDKVKIDTNIEGINQNITELSNTKANKPTQKTSQEFYNLFSVGRIKRGTESFFRYDINYSNVTEVKIGDSYELTDTNEIRTIVSNSFVSAEELDTLEDKNAIIDMCCGLGLPIASALNTKANVSDVYTKAEIDSQIEALNTIDPNDYYTKTEVDDKISPLASKEFVYSQIAGFEKAQVFVATDYTTAYQNIEVNEKVETSGDVSVFMYQFKNYLGYIGHPTLETIQQPVLSLGAQVLIIDENVPDYWVKDIPSNWLTSSEIKKADGTYYGENEPVLIDDAKRTFFELMFTPFESNTSFTGGVDTTVTQGSENLITSGAVYTALQTKQDTLTSGTNIKTINNQSILGNGNIEINGGPVLIDIPSSQFTSATTGTVTQEQWDTLVNNLENVVVKTPGSLELDILFRVTEIAKDETTNQIQDVWVQTNVGNSYLAVCVSSNLTFRVITYDNDPTNVVEQGKYSAVSSGAVYDYVNTKLGNIETLLQNI